MPAESPNSLVELSIASGIVAAVAVPVGLAAAVYARKSNQSILPRWSVPLQRWSGPEAVVIFVLAYTLPMLVVEVLRQVDFYARVLPTGSVEARVVAPFAAVGGGPAASRVEQVAQATRTRMDMWARFLAVPLLLVTGRALRRMTDPPDSVNRSPTRRTADVALAVAAWALVTPVVFGVYLVCNWVMLESGDRPEVHPLASLGPTDRILDQLLFLASTCALVPLMEEYVFRGVLIPWTLRKSYGPAAVMAAAAVFTAGGAASASGMRVAPVAFVVLLGVGFVGLFVVAKRRPRFPIRTAAAVFSTGTFFASVHSAVWPTPVPLFVLGLGLGYLVARTRGILSATIVHGLFNAISAVVVLRGAGG